VDNCCFVSLSQNLFPDQFVGYRKENGLNGPGEDIILGYYSSFFNKMTLKEQHSQFIKDRVLQTHVYIQLQAKKGIV
jgi:hypothetical protein